MGLTVWTNLNPLLLRLIVGRNNIISNTPRAPRNTGASDCPWQKSKTNSAQRPNFRSPAFPAVSSSFPQKWWGVWQIRHPTCDCSSCNHHPCYHGDGCPAPLSGKTGQRWEWEMKEEGLTWKEGKEEENRRGGKVSNINSLKVRSAAACT